MTMTKFTPEKLMDLAESALSLEIEAVRERPSTDLLSNGEKIKSLSEEEVHYRFNTSNPSLRFAEECKATFSDTSLIIQPVDIGEETIVFRFPKDCGEIIAEVALEWENDFILRRIQETLSGLLTSSDYRERIKLMIRPAEVPANTEMFIPEKSHGKQDNGSRRHKIDIKDDGMRNEAQRNAIRKAMAQPVSFIWGPPGTGKTATLAYIIANYIFQGKSVLFVSNTNRAVDHGMLGLLDAMETLEMKAISKRITRFGERILESNRLDRIHFEHQLDESLHLNMQEATDLQHWLDALELPDLTKGQKRQIEQKIDRLGGIESVEEQIRELTQKDRHAYIKLRRYKVVGTTLAKVCTSEMLESMEFDAVVVDEASMANIPFMLIMASKAKEHMVIVGDPMQLPPIAVTTDRQARNLLEQDIFAVVSGANSTGELFQWHDRNPGYTSFFNIQYRMQSDLANVISEMFYDGRLVSVNESQKAESQQTSVELIDSSSLQPVLRQDTRRRGFQPVNDTHTILLGDIIKKLLIESHIGLHEIGIIVPFRSAVWQLRRELRGKNRWFDLEIGTIHTFQGREKKVIILDTVMSGEMQNGSVRHYSVRPFDEAKNGLSVPRLFNVAFSRSRERLVVIADMQHIRNIYGSKFLGKLLKRLPVRAG